MLKSELDLLKIALKLYYRINEMDRRDLYSESEVNSLLRELERVDYIPRVREALDHYYKRVNQYPNRTEITSNINKIRSIFHSIIKKHNIQVLDKGNNPRSLEDILINDVVLLQLCPEDKKVLGVQNKVE